MLVYLNAADVILFTYTFLFCIRLVFIGSCINQGSGSKQGHTLVL